MGRTVAVATGVVAAAVSDALNVNVCICMRYCCLFNAAPTAAIVTSLPLCNKSRDAVDLQEKMQLRSKLRQALQQFANLQWA